MLFQQSMANQTGEDQKKSAYFEVPPAKWIECKDDIWVPGEKVDGAKATTIWWTISG